VILIDTSIWIDFFRNNNPTLSNKVVELLENRSVIGISCVFGELLQGHENGGGAKTDPLNSGIIFRKSMKKFVH
jgi:predicted nucleic acid-binding protein